MGNDEPVKFSLNAEAEPLGLSGFEDEGVEEGVYSRVLVRLKPGLEEGEPVGFVFVVGDESFGAHAVDGGVAGGGGAARRSNGACAAGISFLGFRRGIVQFSVKFGGMIFLGLGGVGKGIFFVGKHMFLNTWSFGEFADGVWNVGKWFKRWGENFLWGSVTVKIEGRTEEGFKQFLGPKLTHGATRGYGGG